MAIVTSTQVKTLMGISGTDYDTQIAGLIPQVEDWIIDYCNNDFRQNNIYVQSGNIAFVNGGASADTITDADEQFSDTYAPIAGDSITVDGSFRNDGRTYTIATVTSAGTLTLEEKGSVVAEDLAGIATVKLTLVVFRPQLQSIAAEIIKFFLNTGMTIGAVDSGGAITPAETYPADVERDWSRLLARLSPYRKVF